MMVLGGNCLCATHITMAKALVNIATSLNWLLQANMVTGQIADTPTRGLPTRGLHISRTGQLADQTTRVLDNSRMPSATLRAQFSFFGGIYETASCPVRDLSSPRVDQCASCLVRELTSPQDVQSASSYPRVGVSASCPVTANTNCILTVTNHNPNLMIALIVLSVP